MTMSKRKILARRNRLRGTLCSGCRHNYYNWPKAASPRGDVAVADDYYCWHLPDVDLRKKEPCWARFVPGQYR